MYVEVGTSLLSSQLNVFAAKVSCVVMDGVTIGHPCCSVHNCKTPLASQRDRFCPKHAYRGNICAIKSCTRSVVKGCRVCDDPTHQSIEKKFIEKGQAQFQLWQRLARTRMPNAGDALPEFNNADELSEFLEDEEQVFDIDGDGGVSIVEGQRKHASQRSAGSRPLQCLQR